MTSSNRRPSSRGISPANITATTMVFRICSGHHTAEIDIKEPQSISDLPGELQRHLFYHERPLVDFEHDDRSALRHPGQQHGGSSYGQPAYVQATGCGVQLMNHGAAHPEGHQPATCTHWETGTRRPAENGGVKKVSHLVKCVLVARTYLGV